MPENIVTMDHEKLNQRLQIIANLGIVAGLVLVGVQVKQNSDLLKVQLLYEESRRSMDIETLVVGEDAARVWAKSLTDADSLSLDEQRVMEALLWSYTENLRGTHLLSELGLLRNEEWKLRVNSDAAFYLGNSYARAWWSNYSSGVNLPEELVEVINARLSAVDDDFTSQYMAMARAQLAEPAAADAQHETPASTATSAASPEAAVRTARTRFNSAIANQQPEEMESLFAPQYELISGRGDRVQGAKDHVNMWRETFETDPSFNCQRTPDEINVNTEWGLARETGHWLCTQTVEGLPAQYNGVYAAKWQTTLSSEWVLQSEVFTTLGCDGPPAACRRPDPID